MGTVSGFDNWIKEPVYRFIVMEHYSELYNVGKIRALKHFTCKYYEVLYVTKALTEISILNEGSTNKSQLAKVQ